MIKITVESVRDGKSRLLSTALIDDDKFVFSHHGRPSRPWKTGTLGKLKKNGLWYRVYAALGIAFGG